MPIHQAEALWIDFDAGYGGRLGGSYPVALKIATGKICAISGKPWEEGLTQSPQNYVVLSEQPWLDGYCVEKGVIRQFVAMPLGDGFTAEEQLTGEAAHGGLQIAAYPMKRKVYEECSRPGPGRGSSPWGMSLRFAHSLRQWVWRPAAACVRRSTTIRMESMPGTRNTAAGASLRWRIPHSGWP